MDKGQFFNSSAIYFSEPNFSLMAEAYGTKYLKHIGKHEESQLGKFGKT